MSGLRLFVEDPNGHVLLQSVPRDLVKDKVAELSPSKGGEFLMVADPKAEGVVPYESCFTVRMTRKIPRSDLNAFVDSLITAWTSATPGWCIAQENRFARLHHCPILLCFAYM